MRRIISWSELKSIVSINKCISVLFRRVFVVLNLYFWRTNVWTIVFTRAKGAIRESKKGRRVLAVRQAKTTTEEYKQREISKEWGKDKNALLEELLHLQDEASSGDVGADAHNHDEDDEE